MVLKNLMEDKKLNFNQPLLSVRRFSSIVASEKNDKRKTDSSIPNIPPLPSYKSELKSGPIRNPGTVPFIWEQSPGRPKGESKLQTHAIERPPYAPKLPPGRNLKAKRQDSDEASVEPRFTKHLEEDPYDSQSVPSLDKNVMKFESSSDIKEESSDSGDAEEEYLDALDTLSRTESLFLNCSVSGVSGLDGPDVKPSGTFTTDPQTRDFMMSRFLPAAKAMTSETPQYAPRKQTVVWEQPRQVKKVVSRDKQTPLRYGPNVVPHTAQENAEEESDDDYDEPGKVSAKVCGLIPRFCLKNSFFLLNPVPGISVRTRAPMFPVSRRQASSSSVGFCNETENEHTRVAISEQRSVGTAELHEDESVLSNASDQFTNQSNSKKLEGSTLYRHLHGNGISAYCNEFHQSPKAEQKGSINIPGEAKNAGANGFNHRKCLNSFRELLADRSRNVEIDSGSPVVEKTLYVDTVHKMESPNLNSCSMDLKALPNFRENDIGILAKSKGKEETPLVDSSHKDTGNLNVADEEEILQPNAQKPVYFGLPSSADKSYQEVETDILKGFGKDEYPYKDSTISATSKVPDNVNLDFEVQHPPRAGNLENARGRNSGLPAPPPLPKSPSDSWLGRTLPSMSSRNPSLQSYFGTGSNTRNQASKTSSVDPKWETIVETTKRFSEEPLMPIPEI